jgi:hypothetical protein
VASGCRGDFYRVSSIYPDFVSLFFCPLLHRRYGSVLNAPGTPFHAVNLGDIALLKSSERLIMRKLHWISVALVTVPLALVACGGDDTTTGAGGGAGTAGSAGTAGTGGTGGSGGTAGSATGGGGTGGGGSTGGGGATGGGGGMPEGGAGTATEGGAGSSTEGGGGSASEAGTG